MEIYTKSTVPRFFRNFSWDHTASQKLQISEDLPQSRWIYHKESKSAKQTVKMLPTIQIRIIIYEHWKLFIATMHTRSYTHGLTGMPFHTWAKWTSIITNRHDKVEGEQPQTYKKNFRQLRKTGNRKGGFH